MARPRTPTDHTPPTQETDRRDLHGRRTVQRSESGASIPHSLDKLRSGTAAAVDGISGRSGGAESAELRRLGRTPTSGGARVSSCVSGTGVRKRKMRIQKRVARRIPAVRYNGAGVSTVGMYPRFAVTCKSFDTDGESCPDCHRRRRSPHCSRPLALAMDISQVEIVTLSDQINYATSLRGVYFYEQNFSLVF